MPKQQYNCIIFFADRKPAKYRGVTNVYSLWKYSEWNLSHSITAINIYVKDTKSFVSQIKTINQAFDFTFKN